MGVLYVTSAKLQEQTKYLSNKMNNHSLNFHLYFWMWPQDKHFIFIWKIITEYVNISSLTPEITHLRARGILHQQ